MTRAGGLPGAVYCQHCTLRIQGCLGKHGSWKHTGTNREHCAGDRTLALPEYPEVAWLRAKTAAHQPDDPAELERREAVRLRSKERRAKLAHELAAVRAERADEKVRAS